MADARVMADDIVDERPSVVAVTGSCARRAEQPASGWTGGGRGEW